MAGELKKTVLVIGVGNLYRRDDGVGITVARRLELESPSYAAIKTCRGDSTELMDLWQGYQKVIVVDAMQSQLPTGSVRSFDASQTPLPTVFEKSSTHAMGPNETVELARALGELPPQFYFLGIQGVNFETGEGLTKEVADSVPLAINELKKLLEN